MHATKLPLNRLDEEDPETEDDRRQKEEERKDTTLPHTGNLLPVTATKLLKMLDDPDSTAAQIEEVLRYDAGLTANILKLTNSAYFGIPSKVSSVRQAIMMLGWKRLLQRVML